MKSPVVQFLLSRIFWKNVLIAVLITFVLVVMVQISLYFYTGHGKKIKVPDLTGLSLQQADRLCAQNQVFWAIQDSTYVKGAEKGSVLDQYPAPGSYVKKNRKIYLVTNSWYPEMIKMPKAYDMPFRQAERILLNAGLTIESTEYVPFFPNYVLEQKYKRRVIKEGTPLEKGSGITLVLGRGLSNERAPVPFLLKKSYDQAHDQAMANFFNLGAVVYDNSVLTADDSAKALVYRQFPDFDNPARLGTSIDIWLTLDSLRLRAADSLAGIRDSLPPEFH
jgi:beta-lactam-binding protein with PASTA domain